ncbi:MAG: DegT/DnrJ/EryC1/StrS family aminotransferase [Nitrospirae bacterium]|nr:DegT/DnrJ/EryC1/StrS family aminotransferase [Nitrospirota bacterium]
MRRPGPSGRIIQVSKPAVGAEEIRAVSAVLRSGKYVSGEIVLAFEAEYARYVGSRHAVAVSNGTAALHLILAAIGIGVGDEVIVPPLTFFATIEAVLYTGARPVFADLDPDRYCLDPAQVERAITPRTKAILAVHLYGQMADVDALSNLARSRGLAFIEDAAQAHGSSFRARKAGSFGRAAAFSFFATKAMTTGEGGMITTDDEEIATKARMMRIHGMSGRDDHVMLGYNYKMTEFQAAMGRVQLRKLNSNNRKRIRNSMVLHKNLAGLEAIRRPTLYPEVVHTFFWYPVWMDEEKAGRTTAEIVSMLRAKSIEVRQRYKEPLYRQKVLTDLDPAYGRLNLPVAEQLAGRIIGLPNHGRLTRTDLDRVVSALRELNADR